MLCATPENTYVIVSNDTGFDAIVKYWQKKELCVSRIKGKECKKEAQKVSCNGEQDENPIDVTELGSTVFGEDAECVEGILKVNK